MARTSAKKPLRLKDELAELERYLISCKENSQKSLQTLRASEPVAVSVNGVQDSNVARELEERLTAAQAENDALRAHQQQLQQEIAARQPDESVTTLQSKCARLESELAAARTSALTGGGRSRAAPPPPAAAAAAGSGSGAAVPPEQLVALQAQVATLKADRDAIEDQVVAMYEDLFRDDIVSGLVSLVRRKENEIVASLDTGGGGAAGKKAGFGKPAPRLKQKLDDATERIEKLEKELKARAAEMDAADRHHKDMLKIATVESTAQADHFRVRPPCFFVCVRVRGAGRVPACGAVCVRTRVRGAGRAAACRVVCDLVEPDTSPCLLAALLHRCSQK